MKKVILAILALTLAACATVPTGYRGVKLEFQKPTGDVLPEGIYGYNPFTQSVVTMNVQQVKDEVKVAAHTKDLQTATVTVTVIYSLDPAKVVTVYDTLRDDYQDRVIDPTIREAVTAAVGNQVANDLIQNRSIVGDSIDKDLHTRVEPQGITVQQALITDIAFDQNFQDAVEAKVAAQQNLLTAQIDAQRAIAQAKGAAASQEAQHTSLTPALLEKMAIEKWDGHFPSYLTTGGSNNINLMKMLGGSNE